MIIYRGNTYTKLDQIIPVGNSAVEQSSEMRQTHQNWEMGQDFPPKNELNHK